MQDQPPRSSPVSLAVWSSLIVAALAFALALSIGGAYFVQYHYAQEQQSKEVQQGLLVTGKICHTLGALAALQPPAGNPQANPSRAYEQQLHATLDQLGPDLGCTHDP